MPRSLSEERSVETKCPTHDAPNSVIERRAQRRVELLVPRETCRPTPRSVIERRAQRRDEMLAAPAHSSPISESEMRSRAARVRGRQPTVRSLSKERSDETKCSDPRRPTGH